MASAADSLPIDLAAAHAMIIAQREIVAVAEAKAAVAESVAKSRALEIEQLKYQIAKLKHEQYGQSSERSAVLEQLELKLSELEEDASEAEAAPQLAVERAKIEVKGFERHRPARRPCAPAARTDRLGASAATLTPLVEAIRAHVFAAERIHADDTTVPVWAKSKCRTGRLWTYVRDDRPFGGPDPPAAVFFYSMDRSAKHPEQHLAGYSGLMQADAYAGFDRLYKRDRKPGPIVEALCWAHARRKFFDLARINKAPIATEAVERIDALFAIEREINGKPPEERKRVRQERSRPLVEALEPWLRAQQRKLSASNEIAKAIRYSLNCRTALTRFLDDGRLCMSNNAAERGVRPVAIGRHNWTFVGSDEGGRRAAAIYTLIETCKLNDVDPQAWLADVLARLPDHAIRRIGELLPWNWRKPKPSCAEAA